MVDKDAFDSTLRLAAIGNTSGAPSSTILSSQRQKLDINLSSL